MKLAKLPGEPPNVIGIRSIENFDGSFFMNFLWFLNVRP